jgi:hypothetical protein
MSDQEVGVDPHLARRGAVVQSPQRHCNVVESELKSVMMPIGEPFQ